MHFFLLFFALFATSGSAADDAVHYKIKPVPASDRTNLEIAVDFKAKTGEAVTIRLPRDNFGFPDLFRFVRSFEGVDGTTVENIEKADTRVVRPNARHEIHLRYVLSFDPKVLSDYTFSPNVSPEHFHAAGGQWSLTIGGDEEKQRLKVEMVSVPKGWSTYSSLGPDPLKFEVTASFDDLIQTAIGGGRGSSETFMFHGKPVSVFVRGKYAIPSNEIIAAVKKIVAIQRDEFQDYAQPFYNVAILPKEANVAGVRFENMFISFFKPDITREQMYGLLAHEMSHNWFTASIIRPDKGESPLRYAWFYEGVNDYFARKILWKSGLLSTDKFIALVNRDIINIADNPNRAATYADMVTATQTGKYNQAFSKLQYYRGALIGFIWDSQLRADAKSDFTDLIRAVYSQALKTDGRIAPAELFAIAERYGLNARHDMERFIVNGEPIALDKAKFCDSYELQPVSVPSFDEGFAMADSKKGKKITGVDPSKAAYNAGLRDGMELVGMQNDNRFGNAWNPDLPLIVTVKIDGQERQIKFAPHGKPLDLMLLGPKSK